MGGKNSKPTEGSSTPPVSGAPADTTQAAARRSATGAPTPAAAPKDTLSTAPIEQGTLSGRPIHYDALAIISDFNPAIAGLNRNAAASAKRAGVEQKRNETITKKLLTAVANGMESASVNINPLPGNLFAEDLLKKSPEFLLERVPFNKKDPFKDWAGRTFEGRKTVAHPDGEGLTAFEYALWAKDFKMLEMMIGCIPAGAEGDEIRACLLAQYEQVTAPVCAGGGLTYNLTYDKPCLDANGIPTKDAAGVWQTTSVSGVYTENHFDMNPLINVYQDYVDKFNAPGRSWDDRDAVWVKVIGTQQRLLPIHILQRYCDPNVPFYPVPSFNGTFKRTTQFDNFLPGRGVEELLSSSLAEDFALFRARGAGRRRIMARGSRVFVLIWRRSARLMKSVQAQ